MNKIEKFRSCYKKIKDPKVRAKLRKDFLKLMQLRAEKDRADKIFKYHDKYRSTKLH
jgi:hypothetical protein